MIKPMFSSKNIIAMSSSNEYVPYLLVYLNSIIDNSNSEDKYDIVILESDITQENKSIILKYCNKNVSIRFFDVTKLFNDVDLHIQFDYFSVQCYYRLALGKIFILCNKVLFTDIDIIANFDINRFFELDMNNYPLAACEEIMWLEQFRDFCNVVDYVKNIVPVSNKYFNTGVLLVDIEKFNKEISFEQLIDIAKNNKFINQEQCVLNKMFDGKILQLPKEYNYEIYHGIYNNNKDEIIIKYNGDIDNGYMYHFLTKYKVWFNPNLPKGYLWWQYARKTPFYEVILKRMCENTIQTSLETSHTSLVNLIYNIGHWNSNILNYWRCKLLRNLTFGKTREHYITKKHILKERIRNARQFIK